MPRKGEDKSKVPKHFVDISPTMLEQFGKNLNHYSVMGTRSAKPDEHRIHEQSSILMAIARRAVAEWNLQNGSVADAVALKASDGASGSVGPAAPQ